MDAVLIDELRLFEADDGGGRGCWVEPGPGWPFWCLSHNLEIAAALSAIRNLSWIRGWDAHKTLGEFCEELEASEAVKADFEAVNHPSADWTGPPPGDWRCSPGIYGY